MRLPVAYWTRFYEPEWEAVSREVRALRDHFEGSKVFNATRDVAMRSDSKRLDYHHRFYELQGPLLLAARRYRAIHAFSGSWRPVALAAPVLNVPLLLTVTEAFPGGPAEALRRWRRYAHLVVESQAYLEELIAAGLDPARGRCILPGLDQERFAYHAPGDGPFTLVFASAPFEAAHMESRGVHLLFEALEGVEGVRLVLLWRGREREALDRLVGDSGVEVEIVDRVVEDPREIYRDAHATVVPFVGRAQNKLCPASLMESLASGKPVLLTEDVAVNDVVRASGAGVVTKASPQPLREGLETLRGDYDAIQARARPAAEAHFDLERFLRDYEALYRDVLPG